jgi:periplasmic protein CpxP/Spy
MVKRCLLVLMLAGLVYAVTPAFAQDAGGNDQQTAPSAAPAEHGPGHGHMDPAKHAAMLGKKLNLSSDQQSKVEQIFTSEQSQMESLRSDTSVAPQDRRSKMMDIRKSSNDQVRSLLNSDQQKKWDEMQSRREERMQAHHPGGQGAEGSPNPAPPQQ